MLPVKIPKAVAFLSVLAVVSPLSAQPDPRPEALASAINQALADFDLIGSPRPMILLDTLRAGIEPGNAAELARSLDLTPGVSEAHCRRFLFAEHAPLRRIPHGYRVQGVHAILTLSHSGFGADSGQVWVTALRGSGEYVGGSRSYRVSRHDAEWRAEGHLMTSPHAVCHPAPFTDPLVLAARTILAAVGGTDPLCFDPTGFFLREQDSVVSLLGAQIRGEWLPMIRGEDAETLRDPCGRASIQWGGVVRFLAVDWEADDRIHVTVEAWVPADRSRQRTRYTLQSLNGPWSVTDQSDI
jgi:hypothetical protein